ncbi:MAG TPA: LysM domain-containing protein, partial [Gallionella sp.]
IARRFKVSQRQLIEANKGRTFLRVGQRFNIVLSDTHRSRPAARKGKSNVLKAKSVKTATADSHKDI